MKRFNVSDILGVLCLAFGLSGGGSGIVVYLTVMVPLVIVFGLVRLSEGGSL